jgi:hypothetical protein
MLQRVLRAEIMKSRDNYEVRIDRPQIAMTMIFS